LTNVFCGVESWCFGSGNETRAGIFLAAHLHLLVGRNFGGGGLIGFFEALVKTTA
jgi:hypothetical protein